MQFISSFQIIKVIVPEPCILFYVHASIAEAAAIIPIFANGTANFFNGPAILLNNEPKNPPNWIILDTWVYKTL